MKKRKIFAGLMSIIMTASMFAVPVSAAKVEDFKDVKKSQWFYDAVKYVADENIFAGTENDLFSPDEAMTRGMFIQTLANYSKNYDSKAEVTESFKDMKKSTWYYHAAQWGYDRTLISGNGKNDFQGERALTREEAVTILFNYVIRTGGDASYKGSKDMLKGYSDEKEISDWGLGAIRWAIGNKVIEGVGENKIAPNGKLSRAQAAQLFVNIQNVINKDRIVESAPVIQDVNPSEDLMKYLEIPYKELKSENQKNGTVDASGGFIDFKFDKYPDFEFRFIYGKADKEEVFTDDSTPQSIAGKAEKLLPDFVGKTVGEIVKETKGAISVNAFYDVERESAFYLQYRYKDVIFIVSLDSSGKVNADSVVSLGYYI